MPSIWKKRGDAHERLRKSDPDYASWGIKLMEYLGKPKREMPIFWEERLQPLRGIAEAPFPTEPIRIGYKTFVAGSRALQAREAQGGLDIPRLLRDGLVYLPEALCSREFQQFEDRYGCQWVFVGQALKTEPNGFVSCISEDGGIYEGFCIGATRVNGWGRWIWADGSCWIGWWKESRLHGNCRKYDSEGHLEEAGWYEHDVYKGPFRKGEAAALYKYWSMKEGYLLGEVASGPTTEASEYSQSLDSARQVQR